MRPYDVGAADRMESLHIRQDEIDKSRYNACLTATGRRWTGSSAPSRRLSLSQTSTWELLILGILFCDTISLLNFELHSYFLRVGDIYLAKIKQYYEVKWSNSVALMQQQKICNNPRKN